MSRQSCSKYLAEIEEGLDDARMAFEHGSVCEPIEDFEKYMNDFKILGEGRYLIKRSLESIALTSDELDKAKSAHFWLSSELMEASDE